MNAEPTINQEDAAIALVLENARKDVSDPTRLTQTSVKRSADPLVRKANILMKRTATRHVMAEAMEREENETEPLRLLLADATEPKTRHRIQREIDGYRILPFQRPEPGVGNTLKAQPIASRRLRRKIEHDARRGMNAEALITNHGRLAQHVLAADVFDEALADLHQRGLSKDVSMVNPETPVDKVAEAKEAA